MADKSSKPISKTPRRPRLIDIARLCGVSAATVSRVLNRDENFSARPEVRERVFQTARRIGYAPDLAARNLNRRRTRIIGVFGSPYIHVGEGINNTLFYGISEALRSRDFDVFFELSTRQAAEGDHGLPPWRFDGAILIQSPPPQLLAELIRRRVPYVAVNEIVGQPVAAVLTDDVQGTTLAMEHFARLGHERIAYAGAFKDYFRHYSISDRHDTLVRFAAQHGMSVAPGHEQDLLDVDRFVRRSVMEFGATAVLSYDHRIAVAIVGAAQRFGLSIPHDFSLICFNDEFPIAQMYPPLTVVAVNGGAMGRTAAKLLMLAIKAGESPATQEYQVPSLKVPGTLASSRTPSNSPSEIRLPESLVVRSSTAPPTPAHARRTAGTSVS